MAPKRSTYLEKYRSHVHSEQTVTALENRAAIFTISTVRHKGVNRPPDQLMDVTLYNELLLARARRLGSPIATRAAVAGGLATDGAAHGAPAGGPEAFASAQSELVPLETRGELSGFIATLRSPPGAKTDCGLYAKAKRRR